MWRTAKLEFAALRFVTRSAWKSHFPSPLCRRLVGPCYNQQQTRLSFGHSLGESGPVLPHGAGPSFRRVWLLHTQCRETGPRCLAKKASFPSLMLVVGLSLEQQ